MATRTERLVGWCLLAAMIALGAGCNIVGFAGALEENRRRNSTHEIKEQYAGLKGKRWAVVVMADRIIQGDHPAIVPYLTTKMTERLSSMKEGQQQISATGYIPADKLLRYLYDHPRWATMPRGELAKELGVDRLIVVDVQEFRLNDPGNQYLWAGVAAGSVGVTESESAEPDEFSFEQPVKVTFPDKDGYGPGEMSADLVSTELARRLIDRVTWMFYAHQEPYYPKY
jgi:hypothetical protein